MIPAGYNIPSPIYCGHCLQRGQLTSLSLSAEVRTEPTAIGLGVQAVKMAHYGLSCPRHGCEQHGELLSVEPFAVYLNPATGVMIPQPKED